mmetsp:Transcript_15153/g.57151  ORF Transcript_15153/g.57151 Transcript_15153/m.57151 type:complete len:94 (+) Transcript_15153:839-1120(+)
MRSEQPSIEMILSISSSKAFKFILSRLFREIALHDMLPFCRGKEGWALPGSFGTTGSAMRGKAGERGATAKHRLGATKTFYVRCYNCCASTLC